jgi:predicted O-methyltransferase YrrM
MLYFEPSVCKYSEGIWLMNIDPQLIEQTKGFLDQEEGRCLYETALEASRGGPCLEIGSYCGLSTLYLGAGCKTNGGILYAVDHHRGSEEHQPGEEYFDPELLDPKTGKIDSFRFFRNTIDAAGLNDTVVPVVSPSAVVARLWRTPLNLIFIDGGHALETVQSDFSCWSPHVRTGGYLLIHDIFPDPADGGQAPHLIYEQALSEGLFESVRMVKSLGVLRKKAKG